jgi:hypothetical protein
LEKKWRETERLREIERTTNRIRCSRKSLDVKEEKEKKVR